MKLSAKLVQMREKMDTDRSPWKAAWRDISFYVRPNGVDPDLRDADGVLYRDRERPTVYDHTALEALTDLAGGLHSFLTNPTDRWFSLTISPEEAYAERLTRDREVGIYLEQASDAIFRQYASAETSVNSRLHQGYLDVGSYGTGILMQVWDSRIGRLKFTYAHLPNALIGESTGEDVDTVFYRWIKTSRQLKQEFGEERLMRDAPKLYKDLVNDTDGTNRHTIWYVVMPRQEKGSRIGFAPAGKKAFVEAWLIDKTAEVMEGPGFDAFPYHVFRWLKMSDSPYGYGPAVKCLPTIRMLQAMQKSLLEAARLAVRPPVILPNDSYMLPLLLGENDVNYREPGAEDPFVFSELGRNLPYGMEFIQMEREKILKAFHADWIQLGKTNVEMTAYETAERRDEKLRLIAPVLGRLTEELLHDMVSRSYFLLQRNGKLPDPPEAIRGRRLHVQFNSPAARAQMATRGTDILRLLQEASLIAQFDPQAMMAIDTEQVLRELVHLRGVSPRFLKSPEQLQQEKEQAAQAQQAQSLMENAGGLAQAAKTMMGEGSR